MNRDAPRCLLVVTSGLPVGGAEMMLVNIVNHLDRKRFRTTIVSLSHHNPLASSIHQEAGAFISLPRRWRYDTAITTRLRSLAQEVDVDAVLCFSLFEFFLVQRATRHLARRPAIAISIHATKPANFKDYAVTWTLARFLGEKDRLISVCQSQADYWSRAYGISRDRFVTIYNGVDVLRFNQTDQADRTATREKWGVPRDAVVILQVARLHPCKRHEASLVALKHLREALPSTPVYLMLVGDGAPERKQLLEKMAGELGISDRVVFCGFHEDVRPFYSAADLFTLTSVEIETFSVAALEAMATGLPVVLTDTGGSCEMVREGFNGYLASSAEPRVIAGQWRRAIENKQSFNSHAIRSVVVDHFSIEACVEKYEKILAANSMRKEEGSHKAENRTYQRVD